MTKSKSRPQTQEIVAAKVVVGTKIWWHLCRAGSSPASCTKFIMRKYKEYTDEDVINNAKEVKSIAGLLKSLGLKPYGGNYGNIKRKLQKLNVDTSHWTGQAWNRGEQLKDWSDYTRAGKLKPHLIKKRGNKCESCGFETWLDFPITLEIHHIDGDKTNNSEDNLQLLCPNCHSVTDNWRKPKFLDMDA
jgi:5-methylcytosine-specific restriction endonuclease McrA